MPGFTTHTYICYRALLALENHSYPPFARIAKSHKTGLVHAKANDAKKLFAEANAVLAGCAYIGCCGPDLFYIEYDKEGEFIADLLHYNRSGLFIARWLTDLRTFAGSIRAGLNPLRERQLAYCLGHISHIAADITIHPYVNSIVGAYPENQKVFKNARGMLPTKKWKFHNILEHYQDAYILHDRFIGEEGFGSNPDCANLGAPAAVFLRKEEPYMWLGFVERTKTFYRYTATLDIERYKYDFFANENSFVNVSGYYSDVIPDEAMMRKVPKLTQGSSPPGAGLFDQYVADAVALTLRMWGEVSALFEQGVKAPTFDSDGHRHRLSKEELAAFPLLGQHWNLDCGLAPSVAANGSSQAVAGAADSALSVAGAIELMSAAGANRADFALA